MINPAGSVDHGEPGIEQDEAQRAPSIEALEEPLMQKFVALGIEVETHRHDALHTVAASQQQRGNLPGGHIKNLFLRDKKRTKWLVTVDEDRDIDLKLLRHVVGASGNLSFGAAEMMRDCLGVEPGSVTPFAVMNDGLNRVAFILDAGLMAHDLIYAHPLHNEATVAIRRGDLLRFAEKCSHLPTLVDFDRPGYQIVTYDQIDL
jgi:Ala-tRNA(Pro) deacylase